VGRSYKVIPQVLQVNRLNSDQILSQMIRTPNGNLVQARNIAHIEKRIVPSSINHFQQLNSATISGVKTPFVSEAEVIDYIKNAVKKKLAPVGYPVDDAGPSRQFVKEWGGFVGTMSLCHHHYFLDIGGSNFEGFRDPIVILVSVPMAIFGGINFY
jgi:multidrug efflux pump